MVNKKSDSVLSINRFALRDRKKVNSHYLHHLHFPIDARNIGNTKIVNF